MLLKYFFIKIYISQYDSECKRSKSALQKNKNELPGKQELITSFRIWMQLLTI